MPVHSWHGWCFDSTRHAKHSCAAHSWGEGGCGATKGGWSAPPAPRRTLAQELLRLRGEGGKAEPGSAESARQSHPKGTEERSTRLAKRMRIHAAQLLARILLSTQEQALCQHTLPTSGDMHPTMDYLHYI